MMETILVRLDDDGVTAIVTGRCCADSEFIL